MLRPDLRRVRGKSVRRCRSSVSRFRIHLACLTGMIVLSSRICFVLTTIRTTVLADPTAFEEPLLDTSISIVLDEQGAMLSASQLGIADKETLSLCVASAKERHEARGREIYSF